MSDFSDKTYSPLLSLTFQAIVESLGEDATEEQVASATEAAFASLQGEGAKKLFSDLKKRIPKGIGAESRLRKGFERRNQTRWGPAFDLLEMMLVCSGEHAGAVSGLYGQKAADLNDVSFPAIKHLHAKSVLIGREVLHLCRGGYPDGALARWRSLHEAAATAMFLNEHRDVAARYLASFDFKACKAAEQMNRYAGRANLQPFSDPELERMRLRRDAHGITDNLASDYEWARPALDISPKRQVNFADIELAIGLDHWRPRYRWASQHTHAPYRPLQNSLGEAESQSPVFLVGPSNSGMVDPLQMTAISLTVADAAFFNLYPDLDRTIGLQVQLLAADEIGPLALGLQNRSLERVRMPKTQFHRLAEKLFRRTKSK